MNAFVFLGPSLPEEVARKELGTAVYLPPASRGDVYRLVAEGEPSVIGIVDGLFDTVPAVVHKEVLFALSKGVRVLGAASMGALRAAELWQFGMEGVGRIFERYRCGVWEADDEVAVVHGPQATGFQPGSVALANIRLGLEAAEARGVVSDETAATLVSAARAQFYADRSWETLYDLGAARSVPAAELAALRAFVAKERPDAKRDDALELLRRLRALLEAGAPSDSAAVDFDFESTAYWERLVTETHAIGQGGESGVDLSRSELERHLRMRPEASELTRGVVLLHLLVAELHRRGAAVGLGQLNEAANRFRRRHGLLSVEQTRAWLHTQEMTDDDLVMLMRLEVTLEAILKQASGSIRGLLPLELKRRGEFRTVLDAVVRKKQALEERGVAALTLDDVGVSVPELLDWYQGSFQPVDEALEVHASRLGFASVRDLLSELLLEYHLASEEEEKPD